MVLAFLGLTLVVGLYSTPHATTFRTYGMGNKRFHTNILVVTVLATVFGGGFLMREALNVYDIGMCYLACILASMMNGWIISLLGLRMGPFMEHLSVAETIVCETYEYLPIIPHYKGCFCYFFGNIICVTKTYAKFGLVT